MPTHLITAVKLTSTPVRLAFLRAWTTTEAATTIIAVAAS